MNNEIRYYLTGNNYIIKKITIKGKVIIIDVENRLLVVKKRDNKLRKLFKYLTSRSFIYYPQIIHQTDNYDLYEYISNVEMPKEQKAADIMKLVANLHNKTTFYKEINENYYKEIYENIINKINYLNNYYNDIAEIIEKEEYMSPSHYAFIRNISKVFLSLNYAKFSINEWYKIIKDKKRVRIVNLHNNLTLDHYLVNDKPYFISWSKSIKDIPIYDIIKMYKKYYQELDFQDLLKIYEINYPWLLEEKRLFFCLISIPDKINFNIKEFKLCGIIRNFYDYLTTSQNFINDYFPQKKEHSKE
ncbi:MAG: hypothetical protein IKF19_03010 [Bacilli bacterium]|nr:hypothetical protein [Bacilli bacterium]